MDSTFSRRLFLGAAAAPLVPFAPAAVAAPAGFRLAIATYSMRKFNRPQMLAMMKRVNVPLANVKSVHLPYESTAAEMTAALAEFKNAGIGIMAGGSVDFEKDDDADVRLHFEYAQAAGMPLIVIATPGSVLPRIARFARQYGIRVALHNHGPEDKEFPTPHEALKAIRGLDPIMGVCIDVGHAIRAGADVVECIRAAGPRLFDVHIKDLRSISDRKSQCPVGEGIVPVRPIFEALRQARYNGCVSLEYEADPDDPLPGIAQSIGYMRGLLAAEQADSGARP